MSRSVLRKQAESVLRFFEDKVLAAARPEDQEGGLGIDATIRAAVDAAEPQIAESFAGQPLIEGAIRATLGVTYSFLGEPQLAIEQHTRACALALANLGPNHPHTLASQNHLANAYNADGQFDKAIQILEETYNVQRAALGAHHADTLTTMNNLAAAYRVPDGSTRHCLSMRKCSRCGRRRGDLMTRTRSRR